MIEYSGFVENFNLINCYVDTSYYSIREKLYLQVNLVMKMNKRRELEMVLL